MLVITLSITIFSAPNYYIFIPTQKPYPYGVGIKKYVERNFCARIHPFPDPVLSIRVLCCAHILPPYISCDLGQGTLVMWVCLGQEWELLSIVVHIVAARVTVELVVVFFYHVGVQEMFFCCSVVFCCFYTPCFYQSCTGLG